MVRFGKSLVGAALIAGATGLSATPSFAQIPPHAPGTICLTPDFWCWAPQQGVPGEKCFCQLAGGGAVEGILG